MSLSVIYTLCFTSGVNNNISLKMNAIVIFYPILPIYYQNYEKCFFRHCSKFSVSRTKLNFPLNGYQIYNIGVFIRHFTVWDHAHLGTDVVRTLKRILYLTTWLRVRIIEKSAIVAVFWRKRLRLFWLMETR